MGGREVSRPYVMMRCIAVCGGLVLFSGLHLIGYVLGPGVDVVGEFGGMKIRIGDRVVDSSVKTKLEDLTRELTKIQLKVGECAP